MTKFLRKTLFSLILSLAILSFYSCFLAQDRTTTVYGTITDENGLPVDSIVVTIDGVRGFQYDNLNEVQSNSNGNYELTVEVSKKYNAANVVIPFGSDLNPKYQNGYLGFKLKKNDVRTSNCCIAEIGQKTKYDFELIAK